MPIAALSDDIPERPIQVNACDDERTLAALAAYQDAMRRQQTWRAAVRAALAAANAVDEFDVRASDACSRR
jgi:hypothetical protein